MQAQFCFELDCEPIAGWVYKKLLSMPLSDCKCNTGISLTGIYVMFGLAICHAYDGRQPSDSMVHPGLRPICAN